MNVIEYSAFLCGCFSIKKSRAALPEIDPAWIPVTRTQEEKQHIKKFYYPEFADFCYKDGNSSRSAMGIERWSMPLDLDISVGYNGGSTELKVRRLDVYVLPYDLMLYALHISAADKPAAEIVPAVSSLRNIAAQGALAGHPCEKVFEPIAKIYRSWSAAYGENGNNGLSFADLSEYGNKLKLFQVVEAPLEKLTNEQQEVLLYELGTLSPVGSYSEKSPSSAAPDYFRRIMDNHKISIFNNWKGLSLFDTFTLLSRDTDKWLLDNWNEYYFGMLYVHSLFMKYYLFRMNILFRKEGSDAVALEKEFARFERECRFNKISYNFLPLEIYAAMDKSLEIEEEGRKLHSMIEQEKRFQEERNERRINNLLLLLTCLTIFSTVWDFCCLFGVILPFEEHFGSAVTGYRLVSGILFLAVIIIILVSNSGRRNR